jgi:F-type H+-transporting ATPase subunit beta
MATVETEQQSSGDGTTNVGRIEEIQGVVVEVVFPDELPEINSALHVKRTDANRLVVA